MEGAAALFGCQCAAFAQLRTRNRKNNQIRYPPALDADDAGTPDLHHARKQIVAVPAIAIFVCS
jgi:hypothetical protein